MYVAASHEVEDVAGAVGAGPSAVDVVDANVVRARGEDEEMSGLVDVEHLAVLGDAERAVRHDVGGLVGLLVIPHVRPAALAADLDVAAELEGEHLVGPPPPGIPHHPVARVYHPGARQPPLPVDADVLLALGEEHAVAEEGVSLECK